MPEISCLYIDKIRNMYTAIMFLRFQNFIIVTLTGFNPVTVILSNNTFMSIRNLFQIYIASVMMTINTGKMEKIFLKKKKTGKRKKCTGTCYAVYSRYNYSSSSDNIYHYYVNKKNLLLKSEPKRQTSDKKIRKFIKIFNNSKASKINFNVYIKNTIQLDLD